MYMLGIMSGTSLDGIDLALCKFYSDQEAIEYKIIQSASIKYPAEWYDKLSNAHQNSALGLLHLHKDYGFFSGETINKFLGECNVKPDYIASHGHTVFHQPENKLTFQLGDGAAIAAICRIPVISDFRSKDVYFGGQGAPLVPIGDELLFAEYDYCLNLGGFANVSFRKDNVRKAFDICPVNIVLNEYARILGCEYDNLGELGKKGKINYELVKALDSLPYYKLTPPKSLGREWVEREFMPLAKKFNLSTTDTLASCYEHISNQLSHVVHGKNMKTLITGGGAFNTYLIDRFRTKTSSEMIIPDDNLVNFKEALIFAFLGYLFIKGQANCLASVTGASRNSIGGCLYK